MLLAVLLDADLPDDFLLRFEEVDVLFFIMRKLFEEIFVTRSLIFYLAVQFRTLQNFLYYQYIK